MSLHSRIKGFRIPDCKMLRSPKEQGTTHRRYPWPFYTWIISYTEILAALWLWSSVWKANEPSCATGSVFAPYLPIVICHHTAQCLSPMRPCRNTKKERTCHLEHAVLRRKAGNKMTLFIYPGFRRQLQSYEKKGPCLAQHLANRWVLCRSVLSQGGSKEITYNFAHVVDCLSSFGNSGFSHSKRRNHKTPWNGTSWRPACWVGPSCQASLHWLPHGSYQSHLSCYWPDTWIF